MGRALRIEYENALYHIFSIGNKERKIFIDDEDRTLFLHTIGEMSVRFDVTIFVYVLLESHYHLLIQTQKANLSKSMQWLGSTYTRRFNIRHKRSGHLFQGRYKSILIQDINHLSRLSCYLHRNPLRAGIARRLSGYQWSSYRIYAYGETPPPWLNTKLILSRFNPQDPHKAYRKKVQSYRKKENKVWNNLHHGLIYGDKRFTDKIKSRYLSRKVDPEVPQLGRIMKDRDAQTLLAEAAKILDVDVKKFKEAQRISREDVEDRDILLYFLWNTGLFTNKKIGELFGLSYSGVSRRANIAKANINKNIAFNEKYRKIKSQVKI